MSIFKCYVVDMHNQQLSYTVRISLTDIFDQLLNEVIYFTVSNNEAVPFLSFITSYCDGQYHYRFIGNS